MVGGSGDWDDCGEKGNISIAVDGLLCMDCGTFWSDVDIAEVCWLSKVDGHSAVVGAIVLLTKGGVFKGVSVSGVDRSVQRRSLLGNWDEDVELMAGVMIHPNFSHPCRTPSSSPYPRLSDHYH